MTKLAVLTSRIFTIEQCRVNFDKVFVFGDNCLRVEMAGQAVIREQKNAIGLATKIAPGGSSADYFTDKYYEENCKIIDEDIQRIKEYAENVI